MNGKVNGNALCIRLNHMKLPFLYKRYLNINDFKGFNEILNQA